VTNAATFAAAAWVGQKLQERIPGSVALGWRRAERRAGSGLPGRSVAPLRRGDCTEKPDRAQGPAPTRPRLRSRRFSRVPC